MDQSFEFADSDPPEVRLKKYLENEAKMIRQRGYSERSNKELLRIVCHRLQSQIQTEHALGMATVSGFIMAFIACLICAFILPGKAPFFAGVILTSFGSTMTIANLIGIAKKQQALCDFITTEKLVLHPPTN